MTTPETSDPGLQSANRAAGMWGGGWRRYVFPAFWLIYLSQTLQGVHRYSDGFVTVLGYLVVAAFAAAYLTALPMGWTAQGRRYWQLYAVCVALMVAELPIAHEDALVFCVYLAVLTVASRRWWALPAVAALTVAAAGVPALVPSWDQDVSWDMGVTTLLVSLGMFGFFKIMQANIALAAARAEVARLAAENERSRIARDLHDLLGHSLTTITVKAGLARRLAERGDDARALAEIAEVEQLSRRTLGDVRAAVSAHHEVTLAGELATAREVLRASGIIAELPASVAETDPTLSELFGWIVREGVTNVVRHSRAQHVRVTVGPTWIEISDDGRGTGGGASDGNGLRGLRERVEALGGVLTCRGTSDGFCLRAEVSVAGAAPLAEPTSVPS